MGQIFCACYNMYSLGLHEEDIGYRPKSSQGLPGLQTALYVIRESCKSTYMHIVTQLHNVQMVYFTPPQKKTNKQKTNKK